ncbi:response regulator [Evansella sp. LMS18]|uniref:response regulator n=1 Tax=Evansella sp. LMS18 TaxID=2924033 RepID=UPI0020D1F11E|nr:response regulator [Evansella sp. LMS18]UTR10367.1 response regulator [Evansella sp. LMS18]
MTGKRFNVLIIEDDFRVADINKQFVEKVDGFYVAKVAYTGKEALGYLRKSPVLPDLILLDVYIPDVEGLELMWEIRKTYENIDIIMLTAAKETETIEQTLRGGIFDYIIKPVDFARLKKTLASFQEKKKLFDSKQEMTQEELDSFRGLSSSAAVADKPKSVSDLPKGIDRITLEKILDVMLENRNQSFTAVEVGSEIGASRSTARRYLEYLVAAGQVKAELMYGDVGRPERRYTLV